MKTSTAVLTLCSMLLLNTLNEASTHAAQPKETNVTTRPIQAQREYAINRRIASSSHNLRSALNAGTQKDQTTVERRLKSSKQAKATKARKLKSKSPKSNHHKNTAGINTSTNIGTDATNTNTMTNTRSKKDKSTKAPPC